MSYSHINSYKNNNIIITINLIILIFSSKHERERSSGNETYMIK